MSILVSAPLILDGLVLRSSCRTHHVADIAVVEADKEIQRTRYVCVEELVMQTNRHVAQS